MNNSEDFMVLPEDAVMLLATMPDRLVGKFIRYECQRYIGTPYFDIQELEGSYIDDPEISALCRILERKIDRYTAKCSITDYTDE